MGVYLLTISSLGLEIRGQRLAINELIPGDDSDVSPMSEDIEQSGLRGMSEQPMKLAMRKG